jgi:hypothetical protein
MSYAKLSAIFVGLFFLSVGNTAEIVETCKNFPNLSPKRGALMYINCDFHNLYTYKVNRLKNSFGAVNGRPVILNLGEKLILKYNGQTQVMNVTPDPYSQLKAFGHGVLSMSLVLVTNKNGHLYKSNKENLVFILRQMEESRQYFAAAAPDVFKDVNFIVTETKSFVDNILRNGSWSNEDLQKYYSRIKSKLKNLIKYSAKVEISALDKAINTWLMGIPKVDRANIGVVVAKSHQARARGLTVTYFAKKFHKLICEGALCEDGLVVMEDKFDENSALELLARHYLDRQLAVVIFDDPRRLQYDILTL